ncbi:MAG: HupE/UreJ family protein [Lacipirellulaceae bacterium]
MKLFLLRACFLLAAFPLLGISQAHAHKPSDSYLRITGGGERLAVEWDIALKDLELLVGLDSNRDGKITWGELKEKRRSIADYALNRLSMKADGTDCQLKLAELLVTQHSDGAYAVLQLDAEGQGDAELIEVEYSLLFELDPTHRGLVLYENGPTASTHILSPESRTLQLNTAESSLWRTLLEYIWEGVWHIWIGTDHILFLICLLIPAVLVRRESEWQPVEAFGPACKEVLKIVTVFTVAHSITLWLSVMEYVTLPSQMVEATIAFSIIVTAANNLWPVLPLSGWMIAFFFGLIHGFGFANVLLDLGLSSTALAVSLLGFNVGVELGQLAIVLVFLPIAYALRHTRFYEWGIMRGGSVVIAVIAALWMVERVGNYSILPF